jgi:SAM-dependent methyltransferase
MAEMKFPHSSFDFVYSSLAMHYLKDWRPTLRNIHSLLNPKGTFLFSTHHPVYWSADIIQEKTEKSRLLGYVKSNSHLKKIYGDYQNARKINDVWFGNMGISYYHKSISEIIHEIWQSAFIIVDFIEPKPQKSLKRISPEDYALMSKIPLFMIFELKKKNGQSITFHSKLQ